MNSSATLARKNNFRADTPSVLKRRSPWLISLFSWYVQGYLSRHFHALRLSRQGSVPASLEGPVIVVLNHPSWWDPLICLHMSPLFGHRQHFAPIEAASLERYRFFERLGFFGIESGTVRGATTFLNTSLALLQKPETVLWITAQGKFTDPRVRPVRLCSGVGHLASRLDRGSILPLALEYPFWKESTPEALIHFGEAISIHDHPTYSTSQWTELIASKLEEAQDALADDSCRQDPDLFHTMLSGRSGVGGIFDRWRRFCALLSGKRFESEHGKIMAPKDTGGKS